MTKTVLGIAKVRPESRMLCNIDTDIFPASYVLRTVDESYNARFVILSREYGVLEIYKNKHKNSSEEM